MRTTLLIILFLNIFNQCFSQNAIEVDVYNCGMLNLEINGSSRSNSPIKSISGVADNWLYLELKQESQIDEIKLEFFEHQTFQTTKYELRIDGELDTITIDSVFHKIPIHKISKKISLNTINNEQSFTIKSLGFYSNNRELALNLNHKERIESLKQVVFYNRLHQAAKKNNELEFRMIDKVYRKHIRRHLHYQDKIYFDSIISKRIKHETCYCLYEKFGCAPAKYIEAHQLLSSSGICWWYDSYFFDYGYKVDPVDYADKLNIRHKEHYRFSERVSELEEKVANGDAYGGHAAEKLCLIQSESSLPTIYNLKYDDNVYAQFTALKAHKYFQRNEQVLEIATYMINNEIDSLHLNGRSYYGNYAVQATRELIDISPDLGLDYLLKLYLKYKSLYPNNYNHKLKRYKNSVTAEEKEIVNSMNRADKIIEDYILERNCRAKTIRKNPLYKKLEREITKYYP